MPMFELGLLFPYSTECRITYQAPKRRLELMGFSESCRNFRTSVPDSADEKEHDYHESFMDLGVGGEDQ